MCKNAFQRKATIYVNLDERTSIKTIQLGKSTKS